MNIRYFSDLHLEFINPNKIEKYLKNITPGPDDVCVCAGDIGNPYKKHYDLFMNYMNENFKKTFVIVGNHEHYNNNKTIRETITYLTEYFLQFDNISFLNNSYEIYDNYYFIGTTLWSKITNPMYEINDVTQIVAFNWITCNQLNIECIKFLEEIMRIADNCIIITHHMPSYSLIQDKYKTQDKLPYAQWYYSNMDKFIERNKDKIKCWLYGHTHTHYDTTIHDIPFLCNPIGYPSENKCINFKKNIIL